MERKTSNLAALERRLLALHREATSVAAKLAFLQRETNDLTVENHGLKLRLQAMEQQMHLQNALKNRLAEQIQRLKAQADQRIPNGAGSMMNFPSSAEANQQP